MNVAGLDRCPFCGSPRAEALAMHTDVYDRNGSARDAVQSGCERCGAKGPKALTEKGAVRLWNHRDVTSARELATMRAQVADIINRRVSIEQALLDAANGKRPLPTVEDCRAMAAILGVPTGV